MTANEQSLIDSIVTKCKVSLMCIFQGDDKAPEMFSEYELAYILQKIEVKHGKS